MIYIYLAEGFEEIEALFSLDLFRRAGLLAKTVSITENATVTGSHGIAVTADLTVKDEGYNPKAAELIMLPGGMPGTLNLDGSADVHSALVYARENGKLIGAICAARSVIGKKGFLKDKKATSYPGFEEYLIGRRPTDEKCVKDGNIITAAGAGVAMEFGLKIIETLCGKETAKKIKNAIIAD